MKEADCSKVVKDAEEERVKEMRKSVIEGYCGGLRTGEEGKERKMRVQKK